MQIFLLQNVYFKYVFNHFYYKNVEIYLKKYKIVFMNKIHFLRFAMLYQDVYF